MKRAVAACVALAAAAGCGEPPQSTTDPWRLDFEALEQHMSSVYANLEWVVQERGVDAYRVSQETRAALQKARNRRGARKSIERFVDAFGDPHLRVKDIPAPAAQADGRAPVVSAKNAFGAASKTMGFESRDLDFRLPFESIEMFRRASPRSAGNPFPAGILTLADGRKIGVVRIAEFRETCYPAVAEALWNEYRTTFGDSCDSDCQWEFRGRVASQLLAHLAEWAHVLHDAGAEALLVDITHNGGGTDWAGIAPRVLTTRSLECPPSAFIKHPHATKRIERQIEELSKARNRTPESAAMQALWDRATTILEEQRRAADPPCDRTALFAVPNAQLPCTQLVQRRNCGILDAAAAAEADSLLHGLDDTTRSMLFAPAGWAYEQGAWRGPLFVLVDHRTASAAEQFATLLQANDAAVVLGERTFGAGCGYTWGGVPITLEHIGVQVWMPDCVRYRADGQNELAGIEPDADIGWTRDDGDAERVRKLVAALASQRFEP